MRKIEIFQAPRPIRSGMSGQDRDPESLRMATVVSMLARRGVDIALYDFDADPLAFASNKTVIAEMARNGFGILPLTVVDGSPHLRRRYPANEELVALAGISLPDHEPEITAVLEEDASGDGCCSGQNYCDLRCRPGTARVVTIAGPEGCIS